MKFSRDKLHKIVTLPVNEISLGRYVTFMHTMGNKVTTIRTHLSALSYVHKMRGRAG